MALRFYDGQGEREVATPDRGPTTLTTITHR